MNSITPMAQTSYGSAPAYPQAAPAYSSPPYQQQQSYQQFANPIPLTPVVTQDVAGGADAGLGLGKFLAFLPLPWLIPLAIAVVVVVAGGNY